MKGQYVRRSWDLPHNSHAKWLPFSESKLLFAGEVISLFRMAAYERARDLQ